MPVHPSHSIPTSELNSSPSFGHCQFDFLIIFLAFRSDFFTPTTITNHPEVFIGNSICSSGFLSYRDLQLKILKMKTVISLSLLVLALIIAGGKADVDPSKDLEAEATCPFSGGAKPEAKEKYEPGSDLDFERWENELFRFLPRFHKMAGPTGQIKIDCKGAVCKCKGIKLKICGNSD